MRYRITSPVSSFTGEVAGMSFIDGAASGAPSPSALAYFHRHGYQVEDTDASEPGKAETGRPARNASAEAWREYAVTRGLTPDEAAVHSRDELIGLYGEDG